ncbi:CHAT domain-containing protein [Lyngbya confervoides]|uniref:CHAT domain-containing protein n=1 Tax=Lyngbya confervoides BDU141951 TaxID=1574623 RepID=A0ABD4T7T7_9CYAN|nr:CHAT domain-containing protein [Lyngbya confervoides]MCM1984538.1 CHAT domain-containing protein [Lyngbya confervoides BDU141951]
MQHIRIPGGLLMDAVLSAPLGALVGNVIEGEITTVAVSATRQDAAVTIQAEPDAVLELHWSGDIVELVRVDQLAQRYPKLRRADNTLLLPLYRTTQPTRGSREITLERVQKIRVAERIRRTMTEPSAGPSVRSLMTEVIQPLEFASMPAPGLVHLDPDGNVAARVKDAELQADSPYLIFIHGPFSSTAGSFQHLFSSEDWPRLRAQYSLDHLLALDHHTLSQSPAANAVQLAAALPPGAAVHLLTYSRGGLIGDLLCRYPWSSPQESREIQEFFADPAYQTVREELEQLRQILDRKQIQIKRYVRVAAPAAGTMLASKPLDLYLNIMLSAVGKLSGPAAPGYDFLKAIALAVIATGTQAEMLPGLEAMMPHGKKGFAPFLNCADPRGNELAVIAGELQGSGLLTPVKDFFSGLYSWQENDLLVDSRSMFRGVPRNAAWGYYARGPQADHFHYFAEPETRRPMLDWLILKDSSRFETLQPIKTLEADGGVPVIAAPDCQPLDNLPVVFLLPGMMGTHLAIAHRRQWLHLPSLAWGGLALNLALDRTGIEPEGLVEGVYDQLEARLIREYEVIRFGFDWRLSMRHAAHHLAQQIQAQFCSHPRPVYLLAHSMGGLIARTLWVDHAPVWHELIRRGGRLVLLGTPNYGSYVPAQLFTAQHPMMHLLAATDLKNSRKELTQVLRSFPGLVELLPYKDDHDLLNTARWQELAADYAPEESLLQQARDFRQRLNEAVDPDHMVYVAGIAPTTPCRMDHRATLVIFGSTRLGDGTVPWSLGLIEGVQTYYVDAEHGQIPNYLAAHGGVLDLLAQGKTRQLTTDPPPLRRETRDILAPLELENPAVELRLYPNPQDLMETLVGHPSTPQPVPPTLALEITNADVCDAKHAVIVGHYIGDPIVSVESVLDQAMEGTLSRDLRLGCYPGAHGTVRIYPPSPRLPRGVIVIGLGEVGDLQRLELEGNLTRSLLDYALQQLPSEGEPLQEVRVSSLLIGSYGGSKITLEDSVMALVEAALAANQALETQHLGDRVRIAGIEIMELFRDIATAACHFAQTLPQRYEGRVSVASELRIRASSRRSRPYSPYAMGWSRRIRIKKNGTGLHFEVTTDVARSEPFVRPIQWSLLDGMLEKAIQNDREASSVLYQYLLPYQLIENVQQTSDLVLGLDPDVAHIPWELLNPAENAPRRASPLGVKVGILRSLTTQNRRINPRRSAGRRALVIGNPAQVDPTLPGARKEAVAVSKQLLACDLQVESLIDAPSDEIFRALYRHEYDIIHIAAHGQFSDDGSRSGVLLEKGRFLTASEFENLRAVPSLVFLNCCHLGQMETASGSPRLGTIGRLAASVAEQLIRMGVGVVVAAGWAIGDDAAIRFATVLYQRLLEGDNLMAAVRDARAQTHKAGGVEDLTWGAYQVYGDPGYTLYWVDRRQGAGPADARSFVSRHEFAEYLLDFVPQSGRMMQADRHAWQERLGSLGDSLSESWKQDGAIAGAFGRAYGELGDYAEAIDWYEQALKCSNAPLGAIEQLAHLEICLAEQQWANLTPEDRRQRLQTPDAGPFSLFLRAIQRLEAILEIQPSAERYSLVGAIHRRWARVTEASARKSHLEAALAAYQLACDQHPLHLYDPLLHKVGLELCLGKPSEGFFEELDQITESAAACNEDGVPVVLAQVQLFRYLKTSRIDRMPDSEVDAAAQAYFQAWVRGSGMNSRLQEDAMESPVEALAMVMIDPEMQGKMQRFRRSLGTLIGSGGLVVQSSSIKP